ncbi:hypothetical protein PISMIDRAFT_16423 [Pisolithus microcarpus 441]|uniref:Uncharacterized protein n=1 Tax=Pisolithus microcarpus 441 TaxID=765257 RepID=A0A0C9YP67_9AGAM|nr:hypothetical protein PISMIDRAFT_16423 [Pisolithus microcarpus 441]
MSFHPAHMDPVAWDFIHQYATGTMTLPSVESGLRAHLRDQYIDSDWQPALKAVMEAEDNNMALDAISALHTAALLRSGIKIHIPTLTPAAAESAQRPNQLTSVESEVMESVRHLKEQNCIFGRLPSIDELVEPPEERELPEPILDGSIRAIADTVRFEMAAANGTVIDVDDSNDSNEDDTGNVTAPTRSELIELCKQLEAGCMHYGGDPHISLDLSSYLIKFRAHLQREEFLSAKQTTLNMYFTS